MNLLLIAAFTAIAVTFAWAHGFRAGRNTIKDTQAWKQGFTAGERHGFATGAAEREDLQDQYDELRASIGAFTEQVRSIRTDVITDTYETEQAAR